MSTAPQSDAVRQDDPESAQPEALESDTQLKRMDPDSILADEADPDQVLGIDSSSDAAVKRASAFPLPSHADQSDLKRASAASAIFSQSDSINSPRAPARSIITEQHAIPEAQPLPTREELQAQVSDLTNQVTGLNEKLVKSFNRIADLEDDYSDAQENIRTMAAKIKELEKERAEHLDALNTGLLVEKAHVSSEMQRMMDRVIEETAQRGKAESDKSKIEAELDELSSSLFSEANKMVAVERLSRARAEEKSRNMEERLKDTEGIMLEQQKVLADLQRQVEKLQADPASKKFTADTASIASLESDAVSFHRLNTSSLARSISQRTAVRELKHKPAADLAAQARLIINIVPYQEFRSFIAHLRKLRKQLAPFYNYPLPHGARDSLTGTPTPRTASPAPQQGSSAVAATTNSIATASSAYSQGIGGSLYSSSPFAIAGVSRHRDYPTLPSNVDNMVSLPNQLSLPFIKRSQEEDVEPCLRLDFAPGLNWLSRRQANTAILDGNLVIEPIFSGSTTVDEDRIRRENAHLPPAACAMCGIPVVNVPLPGGVAATAMSSEQGGKTSLVPSSIATATSSWASSAASSLGSITGSSASSGSSSATITPKPSRGGLFSSFRRSSGTNKATDTEATATATASTEATDAHVDVPVEAMVSPNLPVPTHIFRLSESAPTRYLLCPHHCLLRLRAACQFWGFVRNLERSVVLEGKFMNDEPHPLAASTPSLDLPKPLDVPKSEQVETLEKAVAAAETEEESAPVAEEPAAAQSETKDVGDADKEAGADEKAEAEKVKESVQEGSDASDAPGAASEDKENADVEGKAASAAEDTETSEAKDKQDNEETDEAPAEATTKHDDDDFADAPSSPTEPKAPDAPEDEQKPDEATDSVAKVETEATEPAADTDPTATADASNAAAGAAEGSDAAAAPAPPLPPRSVARGTGSVSPAPAVPPRRHPRAGALAVPPQRTSSASASAPVRPATPANTALFLDRLDAMEWEDKMWTELTKLKEELWRARIGLVTDDPTV